MDALETYVVYMALKLHFTSKNYDYFRSNGRVKVNPETFYKRNDRWLFTKIGENPSFSLNFMKFSEKGAPG